MTHGGAKVKLDPRLAKIEAHLRSVALSFPETTEDFPWGHRAIKVKGKVIVFMGADDDGRWGISVKLPQSSGGALLLPFASPAGYGLGKSGWIDAGFRPGDDVPIGLLEEWLRESYRAVAPKKLAGLLDAGAAAAQRSPAKMEAAKAKKAAPRAKKAAPRAKKAAPRAKKAAPRAEKAAPRAKTSARRARQRGST